MDELIAQLKDKGWQVWGPERRTTYCFFTDGTRIGYAQIDRLTGVGYYTVNKPSTEHGTGYRVDTPEEALSISVPHWGRRDALAPVKYRNFGEFRMKSWQPLVQY
jgi:hypothetical protein